MRDPLVICSLVNRSMKSKLDFNQNSKAGAVFFPRMPAEHRHYSSHPISERLTPIYLPLNSYYVKIVEYLKPSPSYYQKKFQFVNLTSCAIICHKN